METKEINKIIKDNKDIFDALEEYDKKMKEKTGKPISQIIEEKLK